MERTIEPSVGGGGVIETGEGGLGEGTLGVNRGHHRSTATDAVIDVISGIVGGICGALAGQPLDTVKVKMQTFPDVHKSAIRCFVDTFRQDGIARGLYAGTVPALTAATAEGAVIFCTYGLGQKLVAKVAGGKDLLKLNPLEKAFAGAFSGFFTSLAICPTELVKCRLQAMREMAVNGRLEGGLERLKIGPMGLTKEILKAEGIPGIYKGLTATWIRGIPMCFLFFGGYETCRYLVTPHGMHRDDLGPLKVAASGAVGGFLSWTIMFPADVIKSRVQVQSVAGSSNIGFRTVFLEVLNSGGIRAFYQGIGPSALRSIPVAGCIFLACETTKKHLNRLHKRMTYYV